MALIKCPECSSDVSDKAGSCPKCGHPLQAAAPQPNADLDALIKQTLSSEGKIAAIKLYREFTPGTGIGDAKLYVERLEAGLPPGAVIKPPQQGCSPIVAFGGLFITACVVFVIWGTLSRETSSRSDPSPVASSATPAPPNTSTPVPKPEPVLPTAEQQATLDDGIRTARQKADLLLKASMMNMDLAVSDSYSMRDGSGFSHAEDPTLIRGWPPFLR